MSHRANSSLNDTIPLEKGTTNLSSSNQTYYGSDYSTPSSGNSKNSSVQILHEVINLTTSSDSDQGGRPNQVTITTIITMLYKEIYHMNLCYLAIFLIS